MSQGYLKIGDCILLYSEQNKGFMASIGFSHETLFIQKCDPQQLQHTPNVRNMAFKIIPRLSYDAIREYEQSKKQYDALTAVKKDDGVHLYEKGLKALQHTDTFQDKAALMKNMQVQKIRMAQEQEFNQRLIKIRHGDSVLYGNEIQLQHLDSRAFLQVSKTLADYDKECTRLELSSNPSSTRCAFSITPRYKYRQTGEKVMYTDHILIQNLKTHFYIHFSTDQELPKEENTDIPSSYRPKSPYRRLNPEGLFQRFEVNISPVFKKLQVMPFRQITRNKESFLLHGGDVIRLKHAESGGYFCVDDELRSPNGERKAYIRIYKGDDELEQLTSNSLFELELDSECCKEPGALAMWQKEPKQPMKFRFRHLNSGRVLQIKTVTLQSKELHYLVLAKVYPGQGEDEQVDDFIKIEDDLSDQQKEILAGKTFFQLESSGYEIENEIKVDSVVKIKSAELGYYINSLRVKTSPDEDMNDENMEDKDMDMDIDMGEVDDVMIDDDFLERNSLEEEMSLIENDQNMGGDAQQKIFTPMNKDDFNNTLIQKIILKKISKEDDVFILKKAPHKEIQDIMFIHSCVPIIKQFISQIRRRQTEKFTLPYFSHFEKILSDLIFFLTETENKDPFSCEGIPYKDRQKYMREIRVIDLLVDILHYPFSEGLYNINDLTQRHSITRICKLIYRLLKHIVKDNIMNKFYVAQYIELYFNQAMTTTEQNNFQAESTITELLKNNKVLLDKQIQKDTIENFVNLCKNQKKNERFLNLLATLCSCNGEAVASNQDDTCEILLQIPENLENLVLSMITLHGSHEIILRTDDKEQFFFDKNNERKQEKRAIGDRSFKTEFSEQAQHLKTEQNLDASGLHLSTQGNNSSKAQGKQIYIKVEDFYEMSLKRDDLRFFNYFKALINLAAEICLQRNYKGIIILEKLYQLSQVLHCSLSTTIPLKLRSKFTKLLLHLHIDKDPLENITIPVLTRVWQEVANQNAQLPKSKVKIGYELLQLKPFVAKFISQQNGISKAYEVDFNNYMIEMLSVVYGMIKLGFYDNEEELIELIDPLITLLDGSLDFISKEDEQLFKTQSQDLNVTIQGNKIQEGEEQKGRYKINETNLLLMHIKIKIISILSKVMDMQNDIRLTQFLKEFHKENPPETPQQIRFIKKVLKGKHKIEKYYEDEKFMELRRANDTLVIKWMNIAYEDKLLDLERISARDFVCIMLDMILYENDNLINDAFKLLVKFFQQKKSIIDLALDVQLLEDDSEIAILRTVSIELTTMKKDAENAEFWFGYQSEEALKKSRNIIDKFDMLTDLCIKKEERMYDFHDINKLNQSIQKQDPKPSPKKSARGQKSARGAKRLPSKNFLALESKDPENDSINSSMIKDLNLSELINDWEDEDLKVVSESEEPDAQNQRLLRNLRAHEVALILIKQQDLDNAESSNSYLHVLERVYIFLIKFVRNNNENQNLLMPYIDLFLQDIEYGVHAIELIAEIFKDNEGLPGFNINQIVKKISQIADETSIESPKKATLISFLPMFMRSNNLLLKDNQSLILNEITNSSRKNTFFLFTGAEGKESYELYLEEMKQHYAQFMLDQKLVPEIFVPNELQYSIEYIKLLAMCGDGKNSMTELKCQSLFPLSDIIQGLKMSEFCYQYKGALVDFTLHVYLSTEKDLGEEFTFQVWQLIDIFQEDIQKFLEIMTRHTKSKPKNLEHDRRGVSNKKTMPVEEVNKLTAVDIHRNFKMHNCFGSTPIIDIFKNYIYDSVVPTLNEFFELRLKMNPDQLQAVKKIIKGFTKLSHYAKTKTHIRNVNNIFKTFWKIPALKDVGEGVQNMSQQQNSPDKNGQKPNDKNGKGQSELTNAQKLKAMMISASESPDIIVEFEKEFQQLILSIIFIKKKSEKNCEGQLSGIPNIIETKEILKSLIKITDVNSSIDKDLRRVSLKILRKTIELENKEFTTPAAQWDSDDWNKYEHQIEERQHTLTSLGVVKLICRIISFETVRTIKEEAILVAIAVLLGGNHESQMKFFKYIQRDTENMFAEKLYEMITQCFEIIKKTEIKRNTQMLKLYQVEKKIEELKEILDVNGQEIKKLEQQLQIIKDEIKDFEHMNQSAKDAETLTPSRAIYMLQIILRFLQLLCENHNLNLQNQLREQLNAEGNPNGKSFDIVSFLAKIFGQYAKVFNQGTVELGYQIVDCLIEFIQGPCHQNQKALISAKIIDSSRDYIAGFDKEVEYVPIGFENTSEDHEQISVFKKKIVTLLLSLLEGEADMDIITRMSLSLDFAVLKERMQIVFYSFCQKMLENEFTQVQDVSVSRLNQKLQRDSFDGSISEAFEIFTLFHNLAENLEQAKNNLDRKKFTSEEWKAYEFIRSHTGRIEVQVNSNLQRVQFPVVPVCHYISKESRTSLMTSVNRESQATKVNGLMAKVPDLIDEMQHNESLNRSKIRITPQRLSTLKDISTLMAVVFNLVLIIFLSRTDYYVEPYEPDKVSAFIYYLGIVQGALSAALIFFYAYTRGGLISKAKWREYVKANKTFYKPFVNEDRLDVTEMSIQMTTQILLTKGPEANEFNLGDNLKFGNAFTRLQFLMFNIMFFLQDGTFQYYLLYFMISMLGFFYLDIFYAFHLLDFVTRLPVLQNVIKSVTLNKTQLLMTALLQVTIIFIYSTIGFFYLQDTFVDYNVDKYDSDNIGENMCSTMLQCFVACVNLGLRNGGGIGDSTLAIAYVDTERWLIKFCYDCSFHLTVIVMMLNILFGIIIDTFAQLRDHKKEMDEDMQNICFICSLDRYTFDKYSDGFERHIERDHNLWQYVYYIVYLQMKDQTEYTGIESYVYEKYQQNDISWVPLMKALCLKGKVEKIEKEKEEE